ncbi:uncharacterized protein GGS22DRAFT_174967 [Annulohypoxylon maeteangense]|uniref:uncharacterized protein n=1 Tax=Annulohypoxylon maeteangense TaxID=1927788 RepID=UPI0020089E3D|nr:uncharacterized protein GGS22DRAFT_174967 [Annulohypoxylon maeteangense]KAI0880481.1 hypothetical protein GGS22DRAFT_174967 [Annulohypoxylon maeteangense]
MTLIRGLPDTPVASPSPTDSRPSLSQTPDQVASPEAPWKLDIRCKILKTVITPKIGHLSNIVRHYLDISEVCIVPRAFALGLLDTIGPCENDPLHLGIGLCEIAGNISTNTRPEVLHEDRKSPTSNYFDLFLDKNLRWESIGIFCALVASSAILLPPDSKLLAGFKSRDGLISDMVEASSSCMEICRKTGLISDIGALSIYQNLMVISQLYGDDDYRTRRQVNDLALATSESGLYAKCTDANYSPSVVEMRHCIFAASYSIDKMICVSSKRPPMISKLQLEWEDISDDTEMAFVDLSWPLKEPRYCAVLWVQLRYIVSSFNDEVYRMKVSPTDIESIIKRYSDIWDTIPDYLRCPSDDFDLDDILCNGYQIRLLRTSIYLEYLCAKLWAYYELNKYDATFPLAREMMTAVLRIDLPEGRLTSQVPRGYFSIVALYGFAAACILLREQVDILSCSSDSKYPWGETIRSLTNFFTRLDFVILRGGHSDGLKQARDNLARNFDAVLDRLGARANKDKTVDQTPWPPSFDDISNYIILWVGAKDDILRL